MDDIELLDLPEPDGFMENFDTQGCALGAEDAWDRKGMTDYARANVERHTDKLLGEIDALRSRLEDATKILRDIGWQSVMAATVEGDAGALKAAQEDVWRAADDPPDGAMGCWTGDVITVSNYGTVCTIAYFHDPVVGVWQRPGRYVIGEAVAMWRPLPAPSEETRNG